MRLICFFISNPVARHSDGTDEMGDLPLNVPVRKATVMRSGCGSSGEEQLPGMMMPAYKMDASPRGLALIIEIEEYVNDIYEKRIGSNVRMHTSGRNELKRDP